MTKAAGWVGRDEGDKEEETAQVMMTRVSAR